ncbi:hypothetical protein PAXINDRAFT_178264 [Paxillus involutus ATCC 200175]|nr:hypothetical protein PAXINDRAFT_178264 [Paxillus involutus ATCC 200175]
MSAVVKPQSFGKTRTQEAMMLPPCSGRQSQSFTGLWVKRPSHGPSFDGKLHSPRQFISKIWFSNKQHSHGRKEERRTLQATSTPLIGVQRIISGLAANGSFKVERDGRNPYPADAAMNPRRNTKTAKTVFMRSISIHEVNLSNWKAKNQQ